MRIGITGSSGSGKSQVSAIFAQRGFVHIDADKVSREVTSAGSLCLMETVAHFGQEILNPDGSLDRRALGEIVFRDTDKLNTLTKITHKYILAEIDTIASGTDGDILIDAPLLFESGLDKTCDVCIGVIADRQLQTERICARDGISEETAIARLDKQHSNEFFIANCDYCIENNGSADELFHKVNALIDKLMSQNIRKED